MPKFLVLAITLACTLAMRAVAAENSTPGLIATYSQGDFRIVTLAPTPNFALKENESIHPQLPVAFTAQWAGVLKIDKRAKYTFTADGSPGADIRIDGNAVAGKSLDLDIGDHEIEVSVTRKAGAARLQLIWASDYFIAEPVPSSVLAHHEAGNSGANLAITQQVERGHLLVEELNCIACHRSGSRTIAVRPAPELTTVATRLRTA